MFSQQEFIDTFGIHGPTALDVMDETGHKIVPGFQLRKLKTAYNGTQDFSDSMVGESFGTASFTINAAISMAVHYWNNILAPDSANGIVIVRGDVARVVITADDSRSLMDENTVCHLLVRAQQSTAVKDLPVKSVKQRQIKEIMRPWTDESAPYRRWVETYNDPYNRLLHILSELQPMIFDLEAMVSEMRSDSTKRIDQWEEAQQLSDYIIRSMHSMFAPESSEE